MFIVLVIGLVLAGVSYICFKKFKKTKEVKSSLLNDEENWEVVEKD